MTGQPTARDASNVTSDAALQITGSEDDLFSEEILISGEELADAVLEEQRRFAVPVQSL